MHILHLNINSLVPKVNKIHFILKQSHGSIIGISESKLGLSILNSKLDIDDYDLIRLDSSQREGEFTCYIRKSLSYNHKTKFCFNIESIFIDIFLAKLKLILLGVLFQPPTNLIL